MVRRGKVSTISLQIETSTQGGILKGLKRSLSGESFFMKL